MKRLLPFLFLLICSQGFAATYYASPSGGGAASCVDSGANVCTLQRAITVAATGTHTIELANGTYVCSTSCSFSSTNTGANLTFQPANGATATIGSTGSTEVILVNGSMVSGTLTFNNITFSDDDTDRIIDNRAPQVNIVATSSTFQDVDASAGTSIKLTQDDTNSIEMVSGNDGVKSLRTGATTNVKLAQQITVGGSNITINEVGLYLRLIGVLDKRNAETLTMTIETNSAGAPSGTPVTNGTSTTVEPYKINPNYEWVSFPFSSNVSLTASTVYWIVLSGTYTASTSNYVDWAIDTTSGAYAGGDAATYDGTTWSGVAANDFMFSTNLSHTRTLTITGCTFNNRVANLGGNGGFGSVIINSSSLTTTNAASTGSNTIDFNIPSYESGKPGGSIEVKNSTIVHPDGVGFVTSFGTATTEDGYLDKIAFYNNTITATRLIQVYEKVHHILFLDNTIDLSYTGNPPVQFGKEVDGTGSENTNYYPIDQIVVEHNSFNFSASAHNHLILIGTGAAGGVLYNNTITSSGTTGGWGVILKANNWLISNNKFYGISPAIYLAGTNNSFVTQNTFVATDASGGAATILVRSHQDAIYGSDFGKRGIPFNNYVVDNIFQSKGSYQALAHCDTNACTGASTYGSGRTEPYWSNRFDNNIYYAPDNSSAHVSIGNGATAENVTLAEGVSTLRSTWQSSSYTDSSSISNYNDLHNSNIGDPGIISPSSGNFKATSSLVKNKGSVPVTSIGSYQSSGGRKWIGKN